jgi:hypothetical protein
LTLYKAAKAIIDTVKVIEALLADIHIAQPQKWKGQYEKILSFC